MNDRKLLEAHKLLRQMFRARRRSGAEFQSLFLALRQRLDELVIAEVGFLPDYIQLDDRGNDE